MARELTIPLLPCGSIDDITAFYEILGFAVTYRQSRPNPYAAVRRDDLQLHFFGIPDFDPAQSYGSCLVIVPDVAALHSAFAGGLRAADGKLPFAGVPRMTRPRRKPDGVGGFSVVDPGGNWIRISQAKGDAPSAVGPRSRLARALDGAVRIGDSKGDKATAARVLDAALEREASATVTDRVEALVYRAELAVALDDGEVADRLLGQVAGMPLDDAQRSSLADALVNASDLERARRSE